MEIFKVHLRKITVDGTFDKETYAKKLATLTPGFSGADIENICNEGAIMAARGNKESVDIRAFELATERVIAGIEKSKIIPFEKVLFGLGIRYVGETVSLKLCKNLNNINNIISSSYEELINIDEIGERIAKSVINFFNKQDNLIQIDKLKNYGLQFNYKNNVTSDLLKDENIVISGKFEGYSREELKKLVEKHNGKNLSSISKKTTFVLAGANIGPSKLKKANLLKIEIININQFLEKISK